jgi:hypothetical protein
MPTCRKGPAAAVKGDLETGDVLGERASERIWLGKGGQWFSARDTALYCCKGAGCRGCNGRRLSKLQ